jgi:hypothetical protein
MEQLLDLVWFRIEAFIQYLRIFLDLVFAPLNSLGPAAAISTIAFITVMITKLLTKIYKTRRFKELEKQFVHYFNLRQEALQSKDAEKGKLLAKNIDQGKLNRVYYDYFFEGLLNSLLTKYLPIFSFLAYVNAAYNSSNLLSLSGREYIFKFNGLDGQTMVIGGAFWFVISLFFVYLAWFLVGKVRSKYFLNPVLERQKAI